MVLRELMSYLQLIAFLTRQADVAIVGGGVIGIATAYHLSTLRSGLSIVLLENGGLGANTGR